MISVSDLVKVSCNLYVGSKITFFFQLFKQFNLASATVFPFIYSMTTKIFKTAETELIIIIYLYQQSSCPAQKPDAHSGYPVPPKPLSLP